jgi:polysaccharide biosynthesis protein PslA
VLLAGQQQGEGVMTAERETIVSRAARVSLATRDGFVLEQRRPAMNDFCSQPAGASWSPLTISIMLIGGQSLLIVLTNMLLSFIGKSDPDISEAAIGGFGVAILFAMIRPMIRFGSANDDRGVFGVGMAGTMSALALAELAALGGYSYLAHYFGTSITPISFHHWPRAWGATAVVVMLSDVLASRTVTLWHSQRRLAKRIAVYGAGSHGARFIAEAVNHWPTRLVVRGCFDDDVDSHDEVVGGIPYLGGSRQLIEFVRREPINEIVIALPWTSEKRIAEVLRGLRHLAVPIRLAPDVLVVNNPERRQRISRFYSLTISDLPVSEWSLFVKSQFDRIVASILLMMTLPTFATIACLIRMEDSGPVFFRQKRLGLNNKPFDVLKFRTMAVSGDDRNAVRQARKDDSRVTKVGRFLRRSSLDELPQLLNVLRGEMSLVGPRPHPMWTRAAELWPDQGDLPLDAIFSEYASRHRMKPGITGWAQVCGYRGETETPEKMARRVEHDLHYIDNWSLWLDVRILARTVKTIVVDRNAY